jgi:DNA-binding NarL/FixJ family response regulator
VALVENKPAILAIISLPGNSPGESQLINYLDDIDTFLSTIIQKKDRVSEHMARRLVEVFDRKPEGEKFENKEALTKREIEVLHHICRGMTNQQIADCLCVSIKTIDSHRTHLLDKTGSRNTAELVIYAIKNHLVELD